MRPLKKILIIRLSSIGDIVLTTPVVRSLKLSLPDVEIHYLTKAQYAPLLQYNPYIDQLYLFQGSILKMIPELDAEGYDYILDLHNNMRSAQFKLHLGTPAATFGKINFKKFLLTQFKWDRMPDVHIVDRYAATLKAVGAGLDDQGLDLFVPSPTEAEGLSIVKETFGTRKPIAIVLGGQQATKKWPTAYFVELLNQLQEPAVLLGGGTEFAAAEQIVSEVNSPLLNAVGNFDLLTSAALMKACKYVITHDTGFMHIAAAFKMKVFSLWGNTVPQLGMTPYRTESVILETQGLSCRPCSKLGYDACPKGHFKCMQELTPEKVLRAVQDTT